MILDYVKRISKCLRGDLLEVWINQNYTPAGFWIRFEACLVDSIVCGILTGGITFLSDFSVPVFNNSNEVVGYLKITYGF